MEKQKPPLYFELGDDFLVSFHSTLPERNFGYSAKINLRNLGPSFSNGPTILVSFSPEVPHSFPTLPRGGSHLKSVIKSNLQKCIRRQLASKAVRSAYFLLGISTFEALRRLIIIILEDTLPVPSLLALVWLMMASSKTYRLSDTQVEWVLGVVYLVCTKVHYRLPSTSKLPIGFIGSNSIESQVLWSMAFRRAYGGMKGDQEMMENLGGTWYKIFSERLGVEWDQWLELKKIKVEPIDLASIRKFEPGKVFISASIDQHCQPQIISYLRKIYPEIPENEIKGSIWMCRSRLNKRPKLVGSEDRPPEKLVRVWDIIRESVEEISRKVIGL